MKPAKVLGIRWLFPQAGRRAPRSGARDRLAGTRGWRQNSPRRRWLLVACAASLLYLLTLVQGLVVYQHLSARAQFLQTTGTVAPGPNIEPFLRTWVLQHYTLQRRLRRFPSNTPVETAAWSPDGRFVATGSADGTIALWQADSGALRWIIAPVLRRVSTLSWSADGTTLVTGTVGGMVEMIDAKTAQVRRLLNVPRYDVPAVAYAPNGCCLAIALGGNEVNVWTAASLSSSRGLPAPIARLVIASVTTALGWSPDSNLLAIGTVIGNVVVWPASGGASRVLMIGGKHGQLWSLQWSPLPGRLAVGWADGTVSILVGRNLVLAQTLHAPAAINTLAWSGDGALLAISATGKPVTIWEANTGVAVQSIAAYWDTNQLAWSPDGRTLASVDDGDGLTLLMMHPPASLLGGLACDLQGALCTSTRGHGGTVPSYMGR